MLRWTSGCPRDAGYLPCGRACGTHTSANLTHQAIPVFLWNRRKGRTLVRQPVRSFVPFYSSVSQNFPELDLPPSEAASESHGLQ